MINASIDRCYSFINSQGTDTHGQLPEVGVRRAVTLSRQAGCGAVNIAENVRKTSAAGPARFARSSGMRGCMSHTLEILAQRGQFRGVIQQA